MRPSLVIVLVAACTSTAPSSDSPPWTDEPGAVARGKLTVSHLGAEARQRQSRARARIIAKQAWCRHLPPDELDHTPFDHREDLLAVSAELEGGIIHGARIRFAPLPGLTAAWLYQTLACQHDIAAAAAYEPSYLPASPAVLAGSTTTVLEDPFGPIVVVWSDDPETATTIYMRAEALLDARLAHDHGEHEH